MSNNSEVKIVKVFTERSATSSSTTDSNSPDLVTPGQQQTEKTERHEYHSFNELPLETRKYIDGLLGPDASTKFDNISVVSEQTTRYSQPEVRVVNISHKKVIEENRQIPVVDERTMTSQQPAQQQTTSTQGMQNKNIEHVTVHTTRENTTTSGYTNDIPDLQVKNCLQTHDKIVVEIDATGFTAEDILMKVSGRNLVIQGRKEGPDPRDPATTLRKELKRDIVMPPGVDAAHITCSLCAITGRLTVTIPFPQPVGGEYTIPIKTV
ncbi:hypothetical protein BIW11_01528 [Tropilaelaps mercedesae]|uniref:SHSP domain-containing protein n=1 Tax=Tropilaelaps mercedesae TaxID=418985 RepID=A0A1V9XCL4_9ACAR|nr:hypothetical protein BIW11_01528 [Tropilaelaps mercedesae]